MSEIISKWILNRIDCVVDLTPETFRVKTANGLLISQLLHSYKTITTEDLKILKKSDHVSDCNDNFKLINRWLNNLHLNLSEDDIYDMVHGIGSASLDLFYRVFLDLKDKTNSDDVTDEELDNQLGKRLHRFCIKPLDNLNLNKQGKCESLLELEINDKESRDDVNNHEKSSLIIEDDEELNDLDTRTYEELINLQNEARNLPEFVPDPKKVKQILNNLHVKSKLRQQNKLFSQSKKLKSDDEDLLEQSLNGKEPVSELGQTKKENQLKQTLNKQGQDFIDALVLKDDSLNRQKLLYYLERESEQQLHKKIWNEKIKLKQQTIDQLCNETLKDIVENSIKISHNKIRHRKESDECQMENVKKQFEICAPDVCDIPEEIITKDINKHSTIDDEEFENYQNNKGRWEVKNLPDFGPDLLEQIRSGLNVLGYIVHRALEHKYPIVSLWEQAHFPDVSRRVCINGITDTSILPNLRHLLADREIKIIELNEPVDYCLKAYKRESKRELEEKDNVSLARDLQSGKKGAKSKKEGKSKRTADSVATPVETRSKQAQTPLKFPFEEIIYTYQAQLGKTAQELLDQGKPVGDFLLADMFIEYLKSIPDLKGWALVNYPTNFEQAITIEEALTGVKLMYPINRKTHEIDICSLEDDFDVKRHSRLLNNPITPKPVQVYDTALTAFIRLKQMSKDDANIFDLTDNLDSLDKFYFDVGANYPLYYKELDGQTVRQLAKLIIGDFSLPLKSCSELFGTYVSSAIKSNKAAGKSKKSQAKLESTNKVTSANNARDKKSKAKTVKNFADKLVQVPSEDKAECLLGLVILDGPEPGQSGWEYSESAVPEELLNSLATIWETVEEIYTSDLKQVLYLIRLNLNSTAPFVQYVKDRMKQITNRSDQQSAVLSKFRSAFNAFDKESRRDEEFKAEMYCRIEDFKEKLIEMSDLKMMQSENMRRGLISSNWASGHVKEIVNNYLTVLQIELLRFIESERFINDYYTGILTGLATDEDMYRQEMIPKFKEIGADYINKMFQDSSTPIDIAYFDDLLSNVTEKMQNSIEQMNEVVTSCIETAETLPWTATRRQAENETGNQSSIECVLLTANEESDKLVKEWQKAAKGETLRVNLQIQLVKNRALECIEEFLKPVQKIFHEVFDEIRTKYCNEMKNITQICHIFNEAVDKEVALQKELIFEADFNFKVNAYDKVIAESHHREKDGFTIQQLSKLSEILLNLSPSGYITKAIFIFILQDFIVNENANTWNKLASRIPKLKIVVDALFDDLPYLYWKDFIVYNLKVPFPSEREFLITRNALRACDPYSTGLIQDYQFFSANLWFEYVYPKEDHQRNMDVKKLLYKLYYVKNCGLNYTAMLLDFCKDCDAVKGFAKALALSLGKIVCRDFNTGNNFKDKFFKRMQEHEEEVRNRNSELDFLYQEAREEVGKLVEKIDDQLAGVVIEDYIISDDEDKLKRGSDLTTSLRVSSQVEEVAKESSTTANDSKKEIISNNQNETELEHPYKDLPDNVRTDSVDSTGLIHFLPLEAVDTVLSSSVPWHLQVKDIRDSNFCEKAAEIYEKCRNPDFNMSVLSHEYLNSKMFQDLLNLTKKFRVIDPIKVANDVLDEN